MVKVEKRWVEENTNTCRVQTEKGKLVAMHILKHKLVETLPNFKFMIEEYFLSLFKNYISAKIAREKLDREESRETMR